MSGHGNWSVSNSTTVGDALEFRDEGANETRMMIDSSGRLLIGKTSGDHILDINASNSEIRLTKANASDYNGIQLDRDASGTAGGYFALAGLTNHYITGSAQHDLCVRSQSNLLFSTGGATERLRIISTGEVSIGGFTPTTSAGILQIAGGLRVAGSASASDTTTPYIYRTSGVDNLNFATSGGGSSYQHSPI